MTGPYSICNFYFLEFPDHQCVSYQCLSSGYDDASSAFDDIETVAGDNELQPHECAVIRGIEREEASSFSK